MGIPINPPRSEEPLCSRHFHLVNAHKTGTLTKVDYLDVINDEPNVINKLAMKTAGASVIGMDTGVPDWIAQVDTMGPATEVKEMMRQMEVMVQKVRTACLA